MLPDPPNITERDLNKCREKGDYCPVLFEWYKFVSGLCITFANLKRESPALRDVPEIEYTVLVGLINRVAKLTFSNIHLSFEGKFGETTSILDRCIFESCVIATWLCRTDKNDRFNRYLASGLKTELELKKHIVNNKSKRDDQHLVIEKRMLGSIQRTIESSGMTDTEIETTNNMPDLAAMLESTGRSRLDYTVGQRIGSHYVHGTWVGLITHYLEHDETGSFKPRGHDVSMHVNQYVYVPIIILDTLTAFAEYVFPKGVEQDEVIKLFADTAEEIYKINDEVIGNDFTASQAL